MENETRTSNEQDKWQPCPKCSSIKVTKIPGPFTLFVAGFATILVGILSLASPISGILYIVIGTSVILFNYYYRSRLECQECNNIWYYRQ
jgi:hypothetical protein